MISLMEYQKVAVDNIINHFRSGKDKAMLVMPTGTGKTTLAFFAIQQLIKYENIKSALFISYHRALAEYNSDHSNQRLSCFGLDLEVDSKTYKQTKDLLDRSEIGRNDYQIIVFDEVVDDPDLVYELIERFDAFNILLFSRYPDSGFEKLNPKDNIVFQYSMNQAIEGRYFFENKSKYFNLLLTEALKETSDREKLKIDIEILQKEKESWLEAIKLLKDGKVKIAEINEINRKKENLVYFDRLLNDNSFFKKEESKFHGPEAVWQSFFEDNQWIFGFGLNYIFNSSLEGKSLEQVVEGHSIRNRGKRVDALMHTNGLIQSLCFAEIKTHKKAILRSTSKPYRPDSWSISDELAGGIAQLQRTVQQSLNNLQTGLDMVDKDGYRTGEKIFLYKPKSYLIIGSLSEFRNSEGKINESQYSSFQIFRSSISDIEIITFDELYERALALVNKK